MSRRVKILLWVGGGFLALGVLALLLIPMLVDVNRYRDVIERRAEEALGREVDLGPMKLSLLPALAIRIQDVRIGALPGEGRDDLLTLRGLRVGARLLPLLDSKLEVTHVVLEGPELSLERAADGTWNIQQLVAAPPGEPPLSADTGADDAPPEFSVEKLRITGGSIVVRDAYSSPGRTQEWTLSDLDLQLKDVALDRQLALQLSADLSLGPGSRVKLQGTAGPLARAEGEPLQVDLSLQLEEIPLAAVGPFLEDYLETSGSGGNVSLSLQVSGSLPETFDVKGKLEVRDAEVQLPGLDGTTRSVPIDVELDCDVGVSRGGDLLELRRTDITLAGNEVRLRGNVDRSGEQALVDLTLLPARLPLDDLSQLLALAGVQLPFSVSSSSPLEIEAQVRGPLGEELPQMEGKLEVKDVVLRYPGMDQPLEGISAAISWEGETVQVDGFSARIGGSDLSGEVTLEGFESPQVRFSLRSQQADFGELLSLVSGEEEVDAAAVDAPLDPVTGESSSAMTVQGTLHIDHGSFDALQFQQMEAGLRLQGDELTLDPFRMQLYQGRFEGTAAVDLGVEPPAFSIHSDVVQIDVDALLAENLDSGGLLDGKFTAVLDASGAGTDYDAVVASLTGGGRIEVTQGTVGKLDVLSILSKATGVFGEDTLHNLSRKLEQEGTEFDSLSATLTFGNGKMRTPDLKLRSADLNMDGEASVDLLQATLDGTFQVAFSEVLSRSMRDERSRASQIFWDSRTERVSLPLGLSGPFDAPAAAIDWGTAAKQAAGGRVKDELRSRLGGLLGGGSQKEDDGKSRLQEDDQAEVEASAPVTEAAEQESAGVAATSSSVVVRIRSASWGGSLLARDLEIEGKVRGERVQRGVLVVTDASGSEVARQDLRHIRRYFRKSGADPASHAVIEWDVTVDGDELTGAKFPLTVRVEVFDTAGGSVVATQQVNR